MTYRCHSSLVPLPEEGYSVRARRQLSNGKAVFPFRLQLRREDLNLHRVQGTPRMSISGVQDKVQLKLRRGRLELVGAGGDFLLKPVPSTPLPKVEEIPANEHLCMQIAGQVFGIETPPNALVLLADGEPAYLVRRYDRDAATSDGKLHQEDLAQALGRSTERQNWKYEGAYEDMAEAIRSACPAVQVALERLWQRIVFCYAIGNGDAHWKNFSLLEDPAGGYRLAPAYDLLATSLHFPSESPLALDLLHNGETTPSFEARGFWLGSDFLELARRWQLHPKRCRAWLGRIEEADETVRGLVAASFLGEDMRQAFLRCWDERRRALAEVQALAVG